MLLDSLLFKFVITPEKETTLLTILEVCADKLLHSIIQVYFQDIKES